MTLQRFRDFEEARRALRVASGDPSLARRIRSLWEFAARLCPPCMPRGVLKFRTIEEARAHREQCVARRVRALREQRGF